MRRRIRGLALNFLALIVLTGVCACSRADPDAAVEVRRVTGAPTRVVWVQDRGGGSDVFAEGSNLVLMGFDSEDGRGERVILRKPSNYGKPLLTRDGRRIVFSDKIANDICLVGFDGRNRRRLAKGFALDVWSDPRTGTDWVYAKARYDKHVGKREPIFRFRIDMPEQRETVWDATPSDVDSFQVSADGTRAAGMFPWTHAGIADLANRRWTKLGDGCWTSLSPDNSYIAWIFDGPHRNVYMFDTRSRPPRMWRVGIGAAEGIDGYEVYHPRWSNHPRFMVMTGPYKAGGGTNRIRDGGKGVEIYIGRFDAELTAVEEWVRVSHNEKGDFYPDAWVQGGEAASVENAMAVHRERLASSLAAPVSADAAPAHAWPVRMDGLVFLWENGRTSNEILDADGRMARSCRVRLRDGARYNLFHDLDLAGGAALAVDVDEPLLAACRESNQLAIELLLTADSASQSGPARIASFSSSSASCNFTLDQQGNQLVLRLRTTQTDAGGLPPEVALCTIEAGKPTHVVVTYEPGVLTVYRDGEEVPVSSTMQGDFSNWDAQHLLFGDEWDGGHDWAGRIEGVAIYARFVRPAEAAEKYRVFAMRLKDRVPARRFAVDAELLEKTAPPNPNRLGEYAGALAIYRYRLAASSDAGERGSELLVAHWVVLDRRLVPAVTERRIDQRYSLELEHFDRHPQLQSERRFDTTGAFDLPLFYDLTR